MKEKKELPLPALTIRNDKTRITTIIMTEDKFQEFWQMPTRERWIVDFTAADDFWGHTYVFFNNLNAMTAQYIQYHFGIKDKQPIQL